MTETMHTFHVLWPRAFLLVFCILAAPGTQSAEEPSQPKVSPVSPDPQDSRAIVLSNLKTLRANGKHAEAYQQALQAAPDLEGDEQFDLLYGLAALDSGHPEQALFCFERLVLMVPENPRYRLEYARTLFVVEQDAQARNQFEAVLATQPPPAVRANIERFLAAIDARSAAREKRWSALVGFGGGYDTNINNATSERFIGVFELPDSALEQESPFLSAQTQVDYREPLDQQATWFISFDSQHKANTTTSDFDLDQVRARMRYQLARANQLWEWAFGYQHVFLSGEDYQRSFMTSLKWTRASDSNWFLSVQGLLARRDSMEENLLDNTTALLNSEITVLHSQLIHRFSVAAGSEIPRDDLSKPLLRNFAMAAYRLDYRLNEKSTPWITANRLQARYQGMNQTFGETREDATWLAGLGYDFRPATNWTLTLQYAVTRNDSRIDLYDYRREKSELSVLWQY